MQTFAAKLKQLREQAGLTQASLAQRAGLSLGVVRDYEQGRKEPALRSAFKLADALGVSSEAFKDCLDTDAPPASAKKKATPPEPEPEPEPAPAKKGKRKK